VLELVDRLHAAALEDGVQLRDQRPDDTAVSVQRRTLLFDHLQDYRVCKLHMLCI
jgi:hypothetical protein